MLNVIVDTNILIRGLIGLGPSRQIYLAFKARRFNLFISPFMFEELIRTLNKPRLKPLINPQEAEDIIRFIRTKAKFVIPTETIAECRDLTDNIILETAVEAKVDTIVSLDDDLLILSPFRDIPIILPKEFLTRLNTG
jgi:putative PIN family toxin of toxin-antitoxin system